MDASTNNESSDDLVQREDEERRKHRSRRTRKKKKVSRNARKLLNALLWTILLGLFIWTLIALIGELQIHDRPRH